MCAAHSAPNAVLSPAAARRAVAARPPRNCRRSGSPWRSLQSLSHEALANSSGRFAALQQLIDAIGGASDQKAILELQARISRRARHAAERANQAAGALSGGAGSAVGERSSACASSSIAGPGAIRDALSAASLSHRERQWDFSQHSGAGSTVQLAAYIGNNTARRCRGARARGRDARDGLRHGVGISAAHRAHRGAVRRGPEAHHHARGGARGGTALWLYNSVIVDTFYRAPAQLAAAVVGAHGPGGTIDAIWERGGAVAGYLWNNGGVFRADFGYYMAGAVVWVLMGLLCVYTMFLIALSSIALAVLLALGPLFIAMLLFDATRRFFEAWIAQLANYALITILTVMVAALLLQIVESYAAQTAARGAAILTVDALDMVLVAVLVFLLHAPGDADRRRRSPAAIALSSFGTVSRFVSWGLRRAADGERDDGGVWQALRRAVVERHCRRMRQALRERLTVTARRRVAAMRLAPLCLLLCAALAGCSTRSLRCEGPLQPINASPALAGESNGAGDHALPVSRPQVRAQRSSGQRGTGGESAP